MYLVQLECKNGDYIETGFMFEYFTILH